MTTKLSLQRTPDTKYNVRFTASFPIDLPAGRIDLYKWITEMTDADYRSYATAHQAMGSYFKGDVLQMVNVENIGMDTVVQHYELKYHSREHVQFYSPNSDAYVMRWFPAKVGVPWEMQIRPIDAHRSELVCMIGVDYPHFFLQAAAWIGGLGGYFLRKHLQQEGEAFAKDIEAKFQIS
jgi:hypothetical protein